MSTITDEQLADIARRVDEAPDMLPPGTTILRLVEALRGERAAREKLETKVGRVRHARVTQLVADSTEIQRLTERARAAEATNEELRAALAQQQERARVGGACLVLASIGAAAEQGRLMRVKLALSKEAAEQTERADAAEARADAADGAARSRAHASQLAGQSSHRANARANKAEAEGAVMREALEEYRRYNEAAKRDIKARGSVSDGAMYMLVLFRDKLDAALAGDVGRSFLEERAAMQEVVDTALDWVKDSGECHFCGYCKARPTHNETCPLATLDASKEGGK
jgi:hypothetical protein